MNNSIEEIFSDIMSLSVADANELAKKIEEKCGVSMMHAQSSAGGAAGAVSVSAEEQKNKKFRIIIKIGSKNKIPAIKAVRIVNKELNIKSAKDLIESGGDLIEDIDEKQLEECKKCLVDVEYDVEEC